MGGVAGILLLVLLIGMIGLELAVSSYFRYKEWHNKKDSTATAVGIVMMIPALQCGYIFLEDWLTNNSGKGMRLRILLLIICAVLGLGLLIWSLIRRVRLKKGGLGIAFGILILTWVWFNGVSLVVSSI